MVLNHLLEIVNNDFAPVPKQEQFAEVASSQRLGYMCAIARPFMLQVERMVPPKRAKGSKPDLVMSGEQVRALLKAAGMTAAEAARRLDRTPNTLTNWTTNGCDKTAARALSALAAGLPIWTQDKSQAFKAIQGLAPALNLND